MQCIKTRIEWLTRIIAALTGTCILGDAVTFMNKKIAKSYLEIFLLCLSWVQRWDGQQCAARGGEIWLQFTGMICPWAGNLTANFWKNVKSPPQVEATRCDIGQMSQWVWYVPQFLFSFFLSFFFFWQFSFPSHSSLLKLPKFLKLNSGYTSTKWCAEPGVSSIVWVWIKSQRPSFPSDLREPCGIFVESVTSQAVHNLIHHVVCLFDSWELVKQKFPPYWKRSASWHIWSIISRISHKGQISYRILPDLSLIAFK